jgi:hypothetical protein
MKFNVYSIFFLIILGLISGCSKNSNPKPRQTNPVADTALTAVWPTDADVYFAGTATGTYPNNYPVATIWKNGAPQALSTDLSSNQSSANAVAVNGTDVYVAGDIAGMAVYWKNGVFTNLGKNLFKAYGYQSKATTVAVSGNDVYLAGYMDNKAAYWKNGILNLIARQDSNTVYQINTIAINGNDLYFGGYALKVPPGGSVIPSYQPVVWKNGVMTVLPGSNSTGAMVNSIATNGNDVYAAGFTDKGATLWKNSETTLLPNGNIYFASAANAIFIKSSDVYVTGNVGSEPVYWKNGKLNVLPVSQNAPGVSMGIGFDGLDLYIANGMDKNGNSIFWKNGVAYKLAKGINVVYGIAIAPH